MVKREHKERIEELVNNKISNMSIEEKRKVVDSYRLSWSIICFTCVVFIWILGGVVCYLNIAAGIIMLLCSIPFIIVYIVTRIKSPKNILIKEVKGKLEAECSRKEYQEEKEMLIPFVGFNLSKYIKVESKTALEQIVFFDDEDKKFAIKKGDEYSKIYNYLDMSSYQIYEDDAKQIVVNGGIVHVCSELKIIINVNDFESPQITIDYLIGAELLKTNKQYNKMRKSIQNVCAYLEYVLSIKEIKETKVIEKTVENIYNITEERKLSVEDQIEELAGLKQMLYSGLITEEEYNKKKKQVLDLVE